LPGSQLWGANQQAALISWAFNVGLGAVESSTLRKRLLAGEPGIMVVPQELLRWDKANGKSLAGLTRRRAAEVALFAGKPPLQQSAPRFTPSSPFTTLITPHITYGEVCVNEERRRFTNQAQCDICMELCIFIEKARAQFGNKPVIITSGHGQKRSMLKSAAQAIQSTSTESGMGPLIGTFKAYPLKLYKTGVTPTGPTHLATAQRKALYILESGNAVSCAGIIDGP
jgi:hypothetical protein